MDNSILNIDIQEFIKNNINSDIGTLVLKGLPYPPELGKAIIEQIEAKKKAEKKLPTWFNTPQIYYPNKLNIEQTSSELTARYKSELISGTALIDLTGGFGVDDYFFSKRFDSVTHCEVNTLLSEMAAHNYKVLDIDNIQCFANDGLDVLKMQKQSFDWIYIDPSRRDQKKSKVFLLSDCSPNIVALLNTYFEYSQNILVKTSPLLDLSATIAELSFVKVIHIVAVHNEVKELLWVLEYGYKGGIEIKTVNLQKDTRQVFDFNYDDEFQQQATYGLPLNFIYEPNTALLKSGAFNTLSTSLNILKLSKHAHLYTSEVLMDFPGRSFKIVTVLPFHKKALSQQGISKANITTRHFPLSVAQIRKKFKIKDGGDLYLFFTTNMHDEKIVIVAKK